MSDWLYCYPPLLPGRLIHRYKRFFADIELATGEVITAHCPNTGPMTGIYEPGLPVQVSQSHQPKRKLAYTWEMVQVKSMATGMPTWVGVNTGLPNRIVRLLLEQALLPELGAYDVGQIRGEMPYGQDGKSRVDFYLLGCDRPIYLEVKNTTWTQGDRALFPDTVTTRGQKHLRELIALAPVAKAVMLYFINRGDCPRFAPGDQADRHYGELLRSALQQGVAILPCRFDVTPAGIRYLGLAKLEL